MRKRKLHQQQRSTSPKSTILKNGLEARSTKSGFLVEWASSPFLKS